MGNKDARVAMATDQGMSTVDQDQGIPRDQGQGIPKNQDQGMPMVAQDQGIPKDQDQGIPKDQEQGKPRVDQEEGIPRTIPTERGSPIRVVQDRGYAWVVMVASFFLNALITGCLASYGIFFVEFIDYFKVTKAEAAIVSAVGQGTGGLSG